MQADGVIGKYAIGGAVGATFYLEPAATLDLGRSAAVGERERARVVEDGEGGDHRRRA